MSKQTAQTNDLYTSKDCVKDGMLEHLEGKILIVCPSSLNEKYRGKDYQLFRAKGGFGCFPFTRGTAVFGRYCKDGEECRMERYDFIGVAGEAARKQGEQMETSV